MCYYNNSKDLAKNNNVQKTTKCHLLTTNIDTCAYQCDIR